MFGQSAQAAPLAMGGALGADMPLHHERTTDPGIAAEGFYRVDPYEIRFHFSNIKIHNYSVLVGIKHFFSESVLRPYVEGAAGPVIIHTSSKGFGYGLKPEVSLGVDMGINRWFSTGVVTRYFGMMVFGDTHSGSWEAHHGFSLLGNLIVWF